VITWDERKRQQNQKEHGIDFADLGEFFHGDLLTREDRRQAYGEVRFQSVGVMNDVALFVVWTPRELVQRVFRHVETLRKCPDLGSRPPELPRSRYRQIVQPPCRVIYRSDGKRVYILHILRAKSLLRLERLVARRPPRLRTKSSPWDLRSSGQS
jgi:uncharacterized DUF497 family protein